MYCQIYQTTYSKQKHRAIGKEEIFYLCLALDFWCLVRIDGRNLEREHECTTSVTRKQDPWLYNSASKQKGIAKITTRQKKIKGSSLPEKNKTINLGNCRQFFSIERVLTPSNLQSSSQQHDQHFNPYILKHHNQQLEPCGAGPKMKHHYQTQERERLYINIWRMTQLDGPKKEITWAIGYHD